MKTENKNVLNAEIKKLQKQNATMQRLSNRKGFFEYYFEILKTSKTKIQAFNKVNKLYFNLFGLKRYSNYSMFKKTLEIN